MNQNNIMGFLLGAVVGGVGVYYAIKHQDEIIDKLHELEESLNIDHNDLIEGAKEKLDTLTQSVNSTIHRLGGDTTKAQEIENIMEELVRLREEVATLKG